MPKQHRIFTLFGCLALLVACQSTPSQPMPELLQKLHAPDQAIRQQAAETLAGYGARAIPALQKKLVHPHWKVRQVAVYALVQNQAHAAPLIPTLLLRLHDTHRGIRDITYWALQTIGPQHADALCAALRHKAWRVRNQALTWLQKLKVSRDKILSSLYRGAVDRDPAVQRFALEVMGRDRYRTHLAIDQILPLLRLPSLGTKSQVLRLLGSFDNTQSPQVLKALLALYGKTQGWMRAQVLEAIRRLGAQALPAHEILVQAITSPHLAIRSAAHDAITALGPKAIHFVQAALPQMPKKARWRLQRALLPLHAQTPQALLALRQALQHPHPKVRVAALDTIATLGPKAAPMATALAALLKQTKRYPSATVLWTLGHLGAAHNKEVTPVLLRACSQPNWRLRAATILTLAKRKASYASVEKMLVRSLMDENPWVRRAAVETLGRYGTKAGAHVKAMGRLLQDKETWIRVATGKALQSIGKASASLMPLLIKTLPEKKWVVRHEIAILLKQLGPLAKPALPTLAKCLKDRHWLVRKNCARALGQLGHDAIPPLLAMTKHKKWRHRYDAHKALGNILPRTTKLLPHLRRGLKDKKAWVRAAAAESLGKMGKMAAPAVMDIQLQLHNRKAYLRRHAARALGRIGGAAVVATTALQTLTRDRSRSVRKAARQALRQIQAAP